MKKTNIFLTIQIISIISQKTNSYLLRDKFFGTNSPMFKNNHAFKFIKIDFELAIKNCQNCIQDQINPPTQCLSYLKKDMQSYCDDYSKGRKMKRNMCNYFAKKNYRIAEELDIFEYSYENDKNDGLSGGGPNDDFNLLGTPIRIQHDGSGKCMINDSHFSLKDNCEDNDTKFRLIKLSNGRFIIRDIDGKCMSKLRLFVNCLEKVRDIKTGAILFRVEPNGEFFNIKDEDGRFLEINVHTTELEFGQSGHNDARLNLLVAMV